MKLTQELGMLREAALKDKIMDMVDSAIASTNTIGMSYDEAVKAIAKKLLDDDDDNLFYHYADSAEQAVRDLFEPDDLQEAADDNWPKLIAHADEFRVEMDEDEQCNLLDGEGTIRVSMPLVVWKQLTRQ